ncbi:acyl carrier protein [Nonomuraea sp. NPDC050783]|uniref:acyl carrier protein n=1 Tax=Nonomuraea sp. NPDC050783 TaxID=3154634 RepID=UPI0034660030
MNKKFEEIVRSVGELPESVVIDETQTFEADLNIDSLKLLDVIVNAEAEFGVEIEDIHRFTTVGELWRHIELLQAGAQV